MAFATFALVNCSRDPQVLKKRYLTTGNKYLDRGKFKQAAIMYRKALGADPKFGEAYYQLATTYLRMGQPSSAYPALRRAVEMLPKFSKEANDANLNLAEMLLIGAQNTESDVQRRPFLDDVEAISKSFLAHDPQSFEGHKLNADLQLTGSVQAFRKNSPVQGRELMEGAIAEYRNCLKIRPGDGTVLLSLARSLSLYGQQAEAEQLFRQAIGKDPANSSAYTELYRVLISQRKAGEAEALLKQALAAMPKDTSFTTLLAAHYFTNGKRPEGERVLDGMMANFKDYPQAYFTAGDFYLRVREADKAIQEYQEGEKKDKAHKVDYQKRVIEVLVRQGKMAEAYQQNLAILRADPKDPEARGLKATFLLDQGDMAQAVNELQAVVTARPDNFVARFHLGRAHYARKELEQARQEFEKSIQLRPDYLPPRLALTQVALTRGDNESALKLAGEALRISPENRAAKLLQSAAQMRLGQFKDAQETLTALIAAAPKQPEPLLASGVLNLMEKKYNEAGAQFREAYEVDPSNVKGLLGQVEAYLMQNKPAEAVQTMQAEVVRFPKRTDLKRDLGDLQQRVGHYGEAIEIYRALLPAYKDDPRGEADIHARLGDALARKSAIPEAIAELRISHDLAPDVTTVINALALLLENTGKHQDARKLYEQSISRQGDNPEALNNLAYLMAETGGNLDEALTLATKAKQKGPNFPEISDTIGWIYLKKNLSDSAIDIFRDLNEKIPGNPTFHFHLAMAFLQKGDKPNASRQLQLALAAKPNKEEEGRIRELLSRI